jgi:hypothetical protein
MTSQLLTRLHFHRAGNVSARLSKSPGFCFGPQHSGGQLRGKRASTEIMLPSDNQKIKVGECSCSGGNQARYNTTGKNAEALIRRTSDMTPNAPKLLFPASKPYYSTVTSQRFSSSPFS